MRDHPYEFTSDDILFRVHAIRKNIKETDHKSECALFFSNGQPCFSASPLTKRYGWGMHFNEEGKIVMYEMDASEYKKVLKDKKVSKVKAMPSARK